MKMTGCSQAGMAKTAGTRTRGLELCKAGSVGGRTCREAARGAWSAGGTLHGSGTMGEQGRKDPACERRGEPRRAESVGQAGG